MNQTKNKPEGAEEIAFYSFISVFQYHQKSIYLCDLANGIKGLKFKTTIEALDNLLKKELIIIDEKGIKLNKFN